MYVHFVSLSDVIQRYFKSSLSTTQPPWSLQITRGRILLEYTLTGSQKMDKTIWVADYATVNLPSSELDQKRQLLFNCLTGFLDKEDCNFISVDWGLLALGPNYIRAVSNVEYVGSFTGNFVKFLTSKAADLSRIHLIGFSLGAHVVGKAGQTMNGDILRITGLNILIRPAYSVITLQIHCNTCLYSNIVFKGLDPAYPLFEDGNADEILDRTDAKFVDVIHTNAGKLEQGRKGFPFSIGHADFWPNGGSIQPVREPFFFKLNNIHKTFCNLYSNAGMYGEREP